MCGIGGVFFQSREAQADPLKIASALQTLQSRGPDGKGSVTLPGAAFLHSRLSIIDVSEHSAQPMTDATGRYTLVYNGELFNYRSLRNELQQRGVVFISQGDAEVVLQSCIVFGKEALKKFNGFFAFAFYDKEQHTLWLARDARGEKPLYIGQDKRAGAVYFGSQLRTLYQLGMPWKLNTDSTRIYFHLNYYPAPYTPVQRVFKIMPGHCHFISATNTEIWNYSVIEKREHKHTHSLREIMIGAVERRMVSDVPVAAFLSGGIDSAIVCALAGKLNPSLQTFSAGFTGNKIFDESVHAQQTAKALQLAHTVIPLDENTMLSTVEGMLQSTDEPFADSSAIALNALCKEVRGKYKVVLSGDGADELFAGYNKHRAEWRLRTRGFTASHKMAASVLAVVGQNRHSRLGNLNRKISKLKRGAAMSSTERYWHWAGFSASGFGDVFTTLPSQESMDIKKECIQYVAGHDDMEHVLVNDLHLVLTNDMLYKTDYFGMMNAVEIRSPFLDPEVVKAALEIPAVEKLDVHQGKKVLRSAFVNDIPDEVFNRPKHGFEVPLHQWLTGPLQSTMDSVLQDSQIWASAGMDVEKISGLRKKLHSSNPGDAHATCWALMQFASFYKSYNWTTA